MFLAQEKTPMPVSIMKHLFPSLPGSITSSVTDVLLSWPASTFYCFPALDWKQKTIVPMWLQHCATPIPCTMYTLRSVSSLKQLITYLNWIYLDSCYLVFRGAIRLYSFEGCDVKYTQLSLQTVLKLLLLLFFEALGKLSKQCWSVKELDSFIVTPRWRQLVI